MSHFENLLALKAAEDASLEPLMAQWNFDKRLVAQALSRIEWMFPHYSLHDASHSETILNRISRLLGEPGSRMLGATDLWLLCEAAYHHDIGMIVTEKEARDALNAPNFGPYLASCLDSADSELRSAASAVGEAARPSRSTATDWPVDIQRQLILVLSGYFRAHHPERAESVVLDPSRIGLRSPRTGLIVERLFGLLARICAAHGQTREQTMRLPIAELGVGTDECHPRLVAFLLRLGDLLDLDNGRFCPVLMESFPLPHTSIAHKDKHASVQHFLVSPQRIEVTSECADYASYEATDSWLQWLRDEVRSQSAAWSDIAPPGFVHLPSLGQVEALLKGRVLLDGGRRPRAEVDREGLLELLQSANLYENSSACIRELIQNGVDATLIRFFADNEARCTELAPTSLRAELRRLGWGITVDFKPRDIVSIRAEDHREWDVAIQDCGTGIDRADLRFLLTAGASKKNAVRAAILRRMPGWMQPSGTFGIGLQSVFMWTNEFSIHTKHHITQQALVVECRRSEDGDEIEIRSPEVGAPAWRAISIGTCVRFKIRMPLIPTSYSTGGSESRTHEVLRGFDPVVDTELHVDVAKAYDVVDQTAAGALCDVTLNGLPCAKTDPSFASEDFDPEAQIEIAFDFSSVRRTQMWFRGAAIDARHANDLFSVRCNVLFCSARKMVTLNRNKLTGEGEDLLDQAIYGTLDRRLERLRAGARASGSTEALQAISLYAELAAIPSDQEWRETMFAGLTYGAICDADEVECFEPSARLEPTTVARETAAVQRGDKRIELRWPHRPSVLWELLKKKFPGRRIDVREVEGATCTVMAFRKQKYESPATEAAMQSLVSRHRGVHLTPRRLLPCPVEYAALRLDPSATLPYAYPIVPGLSPVMVSPFLASRADARLGVRNVGQLVGFVSKHNETRATRATVAEAYKRFILHFHVQERAEYVLEHVMVELDAAAVE